MRLRLTVLLLVLCLPPLRGQAIDLRQTRDLNLVFLQGESGFLSDHAIRCFENSMRFHKRLFDYLPSQPVTVVLEDAADFGHGSTSTVPLNFLNLAIEPFDYVFDTVPANERINWLMHHELTHVVATDKAAGADLKYRRWFGGKVEPTQANPLSMGYSYLTSPRWYAPRWYEEGIAVFLETWMSGGAGRVLGGYDEMAFRARVLEHSEFYGPLAVEAVAKNVDFQGGQNSYLYGTRFVTYLSVKYGPEKLIAWFNRTDDSERYFSAQFRKVYGLPLEEAWNQWVAFEQDWQARNVALIRRNPVTPQTPIVKGTLGSVSRSYYDAGRKVLYAAIARAAEPPQLVAIDPATGSVKSLLKIRGAALYWVCALAYDPVGDQLFFTTRNTTQRNLNVLDLKTGKARLLIKGARTGDLVVHPGDQALWGIRHSKGLSHLVRLPKPYTRIQVVKTLEYGTELVDIDLSPDGRTLSATQVEVSGVMELVKLDVADLEADRFEPKLLHVFENNAPANFVFSPDGRYLYGTSYYSGPSNVYRYDLEQGKVEALTNAEIGLFRPLPLDSREMLAYTYTATGLVPVRIPIAPIEDLEAIHYLGQEIVEKYPIVKTWNAGSPARIDLAATVTQVGFYHPWEQTKKVSVYPVLEGYKNTAALGVRANFSDPLGMNKLDATAAYSPDVNLPQQERLHLKVDFEHDPWKVELKENGTDFYDLFGPTKVSRKGYSGLVAYHRFLLNDRPEALEYTLTGAYYGDIDTLPEYQNVASAFITSYTAFSANLGYKNLARTIGAVEPERGWAWSLTGDANRAMGLTLPRFYGTLDVGELVLDHSSLWLRLAGGTSTGNPNNPLASYYFGGFGNNWVDHQAVDRYREYYSLPGLTLDQAPGRTFEKGTLEWTLPPIRFRRAGAAGFYVDYLRFALFESYLETNVTQPALRAGTPSTGLQMDCAFKLFSTLNSTLSFGYASAHYQGRTSTEAMVSLKLLD